MVIDNFLTLANFIAPNDSKLTEDNFYFLQIIRRAKDGTGTNTTIRDFYIKNSQDLLAKQADIISFCEMFGARAYFNPNVKSYEKCTYEVLKRLSEVIGNKQFKATRGLFSSAAGLVSTRDGTFDKVWIVDYDHGEGPVDSFEMVKYFCVNGISYEELHTKSGIHFLTKPFDLRNCPFSSTIQKHNPTLLYFKGE